LEKIIANDFITEVEGYSLKEIGDYLYGFKVGYPGSKVWNLENSLEDDLGNSIFTNSAHYTFSTTSPKFGTYCLTSDGSASAAIGTPVTTRMWQGGARSFTLSFWADFTFENENLEAMMFQLSAADTTKSQALRLTNDETEGVRLDMNDGSHTYYDVTLPPSSGWKHYAIMYDVNTSKVYWVVNDDYDEISVNWISNAPNPDLVVNSSFYILLEYYEDKAIGKFDDIMFQPTVCLGVDAMIEHYNADTPWE